MILYQLDLTSPDGGESYRPEQETVIKWESEANAPIYIELSTDGGYFWNKIHEDEITADQRQLSWTTANTNSTKCLIRIVDLETETEIDRSREMFSIMPAFGRIVRPESGDKIYIGDSNEEISWVAQDMLGFISNSHPTAELIGKKSQGQCKLPSYRQIGTCLK